MLILSARIFDKALTILFLLVICSCVKQVDLDFEDYQSHPVVNALLVPDSVMAVHLSLSSRADKPEVFPELTRAKVEISDGTSSIELANQGNGEYRGTQLPLPGKEYKLKVLLENGELLKSKTKIPTSPDIKIYPDLENNLAKVTIIDNSLEKNFYWIGLKVLDIESSYAYYATYFYSDFLLFDDFNRTQGGEIIEGVKYSYHFFARLDDYNFNGKEISFYTPRRWPTSGKKIDYVLILYIINADEHLDRYMKSALIQYDLRVIGDMPVFHTPINMYSNIENGKGIFGSYTMSQFDITTPSILRL